jgi:hypothetical protein
MGHGVRLELPAMKNLLAHVVLRVLDVAHPPKWIEIANYGDWHPGVPPGKVKIHATINGNTDISARRRYFLVDAAEHAGSTKPFQINIDKHQEIQ